MGRQAQLAGTPLVFVLVRAVVREAEDIPWNRTLGFLTEAAVVDRISAPAVDALALFPALLHELQMAFGMGLQNLTVVAADLFRVVRHPVDEIIGRVELLARFAGPLTWAGWPGRVLPDQPIHQVKPEPVTSNPFKRP